MATQHKRPKFSVNGHLIQTPPDALRITAAARLQAAEQLVLAYGQSAIIPSSVRPVANSRSSAYGRLNSWHRLRAVILCIVLLALRMIPAARLWAAGDNSFERPPFREQPPLPTGSRTAAARLRAAMLSIVFFGAAYDNHPLAQAANQPTSETRMESEASTSALSPCQSETFPPLPQRASSGASRMQGMPPR